VNRSRQRRSLTWCCIAPLGLLSVVLVGCDEGKTPKAEVGRWDLFAAPLVEHWREAKIESSGGMTRETDGFTLKEGAPMTGNVLPTWTEDGLPLTDYAINYEATRLNGHDFFGSVTFPVGKADRCVTFVLGGWGGSQVGISSIDGYDASENTTGSSQHFEDNRWYRVRIEVTDRFLKVLLDGRLIINTNITGRSLSLRGGDIHQCVPFGFATYGTTGRVRGCVIEKLAVP
jgi:hypothetical protein